MVTIMLTYFDVYILFVNLVYFICINNVIFMIKILVLMQN